MTRFTDEGYTDEDELAIEQPGVPHRAEDAGFADISMREREGAVQSLSSCHRK